MNIRLASFDGFSFRGVYGRSWIQFIKDLYKEINDDNLMTGAASLAYYLMLAIFPGMIFLLGLLPYLPIPNLQQEIMTLLGQLIPGESAQLFTKTISEVVGQKKDGILSLGAVLTLWAASSGMASVMDQLNVSYDVKEGRSFIKARAIAIGLTVGFGALVLTSFVCIVMGETIQEWMAQHWAWSGPGLFAFDVLRWVIVVLAITFALAVTYYFGPDVEQKLIFVTPGSLIATLLLILVSLAFKMYVDHFNSYNATYGSLGAVIVLMVWLNLLGAVVLLGSQFNALFEHYNPDGKNKGQKIETEEPKSSVPPVPEDRKPLPPRVAKAEFR